MTISYYSRTSLERHLLSAILCFTTPFLSNVFIKARNQTRFQRHCVFYVIFENVWVPIKIGSTVHKMNETVWNIVSKMRIPIVAPLQNYVFLFLSCHVHSFSMKRIQNNKISFIVTYYFSENNLGLFLPVPVTPKLVLEVSFVAFFVSKRCFTFYPVNNVPIYCYKSYQFLKQ